MINYKQTPPLFHYSKAPYLVEIFDTGKIQLATAGVPVGERPAVWLSSDPWIEWTAYPQASAEELEQSEYQPVRFCLDPAALLCGATMVVPWLKHRKLCRMDTRYADGLEASGRALGADYRSWWCSYEPISVKHFTTVEMLINSKWVVIAYREEATCCRN